MKNTIIQDISLQRVLNSRGRPTIECDIITVEGTGRSSAPLPAFGVEYDMEQLIEKTRMEIVPELIGIDTEEQNSLDNALKDLNTSARLPAFVLTALSYGAANACANTLGIPLYKHLGGIVKNALPYPASSIISGGRASGKHAPDFKEFLCIPVGAKSFREAVMLNSRVHEKAREIIPKKDKYFTGAKEDEGAWSPRLTNEEALDALQEAITAVSQETGSEIKMGIDFSACCDLYDGKKDKYVYSKGEKEVNGDEQMEYALKVIDEYELYYVEDVFNDVDFTRTKALTEKVNCIVAGDDLFKSDINILGKNLGAGNAITVKMDWIGTVTDAYELIDYAKNHSYSPLISQRAGETADNTIAHIAVAFRLPFIKMGIVGGAHTEKLNELLRIEEELEVPEMAELPTGQKR